MVTDYFFTCSTRRAARAFSSNGAGKIWLYYFNQDLSWLESFIFGDGLLGNYHSSELDFVFGNEWPLGLHSFTDSERNLSNEMMTYWTNMARYGSPNSAETKTQWPSYQYNTSIKAENFMNLRTPLQADEDLMGEKCDFWDKIVEKLQSGGQY